MVENNRIIIQTDLSKIAECNERMRIVLLTRTMNKLLKGNLTKSPKPEMAILRYRIVVRSTYSSNA